MTNYVSLGFMQISFQQVHSMQDAWSVYFPADSVPNLKYLPQDVYQNSFIPCTVSGRSLSGLSCPHSVLWDSQYVLIHIIIIIIASF